MAAAFEVVHSVVLVAARKKTRGAAEMRHLIATALIVCVTATDLTVSSGQTETLQAGTHTYTNVVIDGVLEIDGATRDFALSEWELHSNRAGVGLSLRTARTETAKLTVELQSGAGELYDLRDDPREMVNRFDDPSYKALKDELDAYMNVT